MTADPDPVEQLRGRAAGEGEDPYEDVDISTLPDWWRGAIEEFERHGLRPYRPPRLSDGELKHTVVEDLEDEHGVTIEFVGVGVTHGDDWTMRIDGENVIGVGHHRSAEGYSVFDLERDALRRLVREHVADGGG